MKACEIAGVEPRFERLTAKPASVKCMIMDASRLSPVMPHYIHGDSPDLDSHAGCRACAFV
jgi:hypothetical protein